VIRDLPFKHNRKALGLEVFRLAELFDRADREELGHAIDAPQRPEFHTIYVGLRGSGRIVVDFTPVPLGAGYLTFVARGRVQQFVPDPQRAVDAWMILVEPELVGSYAAEDPLRSPSVLSPAWPEPVIAVPREARAELEVVMELLRVEHARALDRFQPALLAAQLRVLLLLAERLQTWSVTSTRALEQFFAVLERDHAGTRNVAHYARAAAISRRRLGELLVEHTGKSTKQVIDERVVLELKRLLVHTELSVKELADRLGFAEPTNLIKFFRHHAGVTPLEFRRGSTILPSGRESSPRRRRPR
jgi:AraC family transcriptional regulator, transcriptional activator of pobA